MKVFAVYDGAVKQYCRPFHLISVAEALRGWMDVVNDPKTDFYKHPADYTLFHVAEYDESTGQFTNLHTPEALGTALRFKNVPPLKTAE